MDPSNSQYQAMMNNTHSLQGVVVLDQYCSSNSSKKHQEKTQRPQPEALKCPRCDSGNTKFCYYNNYSLTQPRYFCKACRRYWTKGGSLRNVPVGGGVRKNHSIIKKSSTPSSKVMMKSSSSSTTTTNQSDHDQQAVLITNNNSNPLLFNLPNIPSTNYDTNDLTLAFGRLHKQQTPTRQQFGFDDHANNNNSTIFGNPKATTHFDILGNPNTTSGFIDALRSGFLDAPSTNNGFQNLYDYGNMEEVENSSGGGGGVASHDQQGMMGLPYEEINSAKEELLLKGEGIRENINGDQNRVLWNFPWEQFGTDQDQGSAGTGRDINQCWNNGTSLGSSWHGLVNTTL